jgi:cell division protease FtsH
MCYGGRIAEELVFGRERVTTGASSDIQRATGVARRYVTQWGLSDAVGPVAITENSQEVFLGRDFGQRREVSEKMAELVDAEVGRVLNEALERARATITEHRDLLDRMAVALLERETLGDARRSTSWSRARSSAHAPGADLRPPGPSVVAARHQGPSVDRGGGVEAEAGLTAVLSAQCAVLSAQLRGHADDSACPRAVLQSLCGSV